MKKHFSFFQFYSICLFLSVLAWLIYYLSPKEQTLEDFFKSSQANLKRYSLAELTGFDSIQDKDIFEFFYRETQNTSTTYLFVQSSYLSPLQARILSQFQGEWLFLNALKQLNEETAKALVQWPGRVLGLSGVKQLDETTAKVLAQWEGDYLELNGVKQFDEATAKVLAQYKGTIYTTEKIEAQIKKYKSF